MFTQRDEEDYIINFFNRKNGRFLDIGAYDGKCFSTTHALALLGWDGVCVEPSPSVTPALKELYKNNSGIQIIERVITETTGEVTFYDCGGDMVSSVNTEHVKLWKEKGGCTFKELKLRSLSVPDLFVLAGYNFDFISLDVEATNLQILSKFPFKKLDSVKMLCVEFDHKSEEMLSLTKPFGFKLLHRTAENLLLVR